MTRSFVKIMFSLRLVDGYIEPKSYSIVRRVMFCFPYSYLHSSGYKLGYFWVL